MKSSSLSSSHRLYNATSEPIRRALVVDDSNVLRTLAGRIVGRFGYQVDYAVHGYEAVQRWLHRDYDLIVMDCHMPVMGGPSAARAIRRLASETRRRPWIVACTDDVSRENRLDCEQAGMDAFLPKPITSVAVADILGGLYPASHEREATLLPLH